MEQSAQLRRPLRIFLCHSSDDKSAVRALCCRLSADGFSPWLDEESLLPGQEWEQEISKAVRNSDVVIVCLSHSSISKRGYVQKEIRYALDAADEQPENTIYLIPLKLEECHIPERLCHWQSVNYFDKKGYEKLRRALTSRADTLLEESVQDTASGNFQFMPATTLDVNEQEIPSLRSDESSIREVVKDYLDRQVLMKKETYDSVARDVAFYLCPTALVILSLLIGELIVGSFPGLFLLLLFGAPIVMQIIPSDNDRGNLMPYLIVLSGSLLSGLIMYLFLPDLGFHPGGLILTSIGTMVLLIAWRMLVHRD